MFIDTHCHLGKEFFEEDLDTVLKNAAEANVHNIIVPGTNPTDIKESFELAKKYDELYCTLGIHPEYAKHNITGLDEILNLEMLANPKVLGVGEIGLDYHYGNESRIFQIDLFKRQLEIAKKANLPVAIHTRNAEKDTAEILDGSITGVMHCYTSSWDLAKKMLDRGFMFSASGILTFKNSEEVRDVFRKVPIDRIVIETDGPYCAPVPNRGKRCEPAMVVDTARVLADIKNLHLSELEDILMKNTKKLYPKWQDK